MDGFKEFQGKDLDSAIAEACGYFDLPREKLEIEILQDAKTGIFGIVGARKAKVRARRAQLREAVESVLGPRGGQRAKTAAGDRDAPAEGQGRQGTSGDAAPRPQPKKPRAERRPLPPDSSAARAPETPDAESAAQAGDVAATAIQPAEADARAAAATEAKRRPAAGRPRAASSRTGGASPQERPVIEDAEGTHDVPVRCAPPAQDPDADDAPEGLPRTPVEDLDPEKLQSLTEATVRELVRPITGGRVPVSVRVEDGRVRANVDWSGDAGLLIGREGQTLAALQYLASRMVSHGMDAAVRVQLDIGDYRLRQDEKLRAIALSLAEKARATGRPYSTRPLSSYHRRIIHLSLQDAEDLQTRSSGDGPLKRVVISRRRPGEA